MIISGHSVRPLEAGGHRESRAQRPILIYTCTAAMPSLGNLFVLAVLAGLGLTRAEPEASDALTRDSECEQGQCALNALQPMGLH